MPVMGYFFFFLKKDADCSKGDRIEKCLLLNPILGSPPLPQKLSLLPAHCVHFQILYKECGCVTVCVGAHLNTPADGTLLFSPFCVLLFPTEECSFQLVFYFSIFPLLFSVCPDVL